MEYYVSDAVLDALKCTFCKEKLATKMVPKCGSSICQECHSNLRERLITSQRFVCQACGGWHLMPPEGLTDSQALVKILQLEPERRELPGEVLEVQSLIAETRRQIEKLDAFNAIEETNAVCDRLSSETRQTLANQKAELSQFGDDLLREVEGQRRAVISVLSHGSCPSNNYPSVKRQRLVGAKASEILAEFERFSSEWTRHITKLSREISGVYVQKAHLTVLEFGQRILALERRLRSGILGGWLVEWAESISSRTNSFAWRSAVRCQSPADETDRLISIISDVNNNDFEFLPDGRLVVWESAGCFKIYHAGHQRALLRFPVAKISVICCLTNDILAAGCSDMSIKILDLKHRRIAQVLEGHAAKIISMAALNDGNLASIALDRSIKIWDLGTGRLLGSIDHGPFMADMSLSTLPNGNLVTFSIVNESQEIYTINIWEPKTGNLVSSIDLKVRISSYAVLSDEMIAIGTSEGLVKLLDLKTGAEIRTLATRFYGKVSSIIQLKNGFLAVSSLWTGVTSMVNLDNDTVVESLETNTTSTSRIQLSHDGRFLATSFGNSRIKLWSLS